VVHFQDQGQGDDEQLEDILDNDLTWELEIARRKKRWRLKEDELRSEKVRNSDAGIAEEDRTLQQLYHDPSIKSRQPKQVFTSAAASGILTNDLVQIMDTAETTGIEADTVEDNIFQWNVKIRNFSER
jgi:baculoviral IAP repeat-containing protein 6